MIILLTWIAWFSIVVAVFLGLLNSLVVVAAYLAILGVLLLAGLALYKHQNQGD